MDTNDTVMEALDTTNTPFDPLLIDVTLFVTDDVVDGWIVVDCVNAVDADSLVSCVPPINFTLNEVPDV